MTQKESNAINCVANKDNDCEDCELNDKLLCRFEKKFANKFLVGNIFYRVLANIILIFAGILTEQWWMLYTYIIAIFLTFFMIEPRLLCSHCPHYAKEGKVLKCWALRGMPKFWKYRPVPISKIEKNIMLVVGAFIDLFPYFGFIIGLLDFILNPIGAISSGLGLIITTILFTVVVIYFSKILLGYACKHCSNFSCAMNKVSEDVIKSFLAKNPILKSAFEKRELAD